MKLARQAVFRTNLDSPPDLRTALQYLWEEIARAINRNEATKTVGPVVKKTGNYTLQLTDEMVLVDATLAPVSVTLPNIDEVEMGRLFTVKKIDATGNAVTVAGDADVDGSAGGISITVQYESRTVQTDGIVWWIK